jgi:signal peptidase I
LGVARVALSIKPVTGRAAAVARGYLDALIAAGLIALFVITFVLRTFYIPSVSMVPTLQVGDVLLVDEIAYRVGSPAEGDVAIFRPPFEATEDYVKRVIGLPGDTIAIVNGTVYRNGAALRESYDNQPPKYNLSIRGYDIYVNDVPLDRRTATIPRRALWSAPNRIPNGYYFVLGDNRNYSDDSHVWGFVQRGRFVGRAFLILWPLERLHALAR